VSAICRHHHEFYISINGSISSIDAPLLAYQEGLSSMDLVIWSVSQSVNRSVGLSVRSSVSKSVNRSVGQSVNQSVIQSVSQSVS
jgi:hypothetical protein